MQLIYAEDGELRHDGLSLTTQYGDVKMALGQISGKDIRHYIRRFFQLNQEVKEARFIGRHCRKQKL